MAKTRVGQKPDRVFKFLMGLRHPKVARAMKSFGFSDANLQDGWKRLEAAAELAMVEEPGASPNPKVVQELNDFENVWFAVAKATLKGNFPDVHDALFAKLSQASGRDVALTVGPFVKRIREMEAAEGSFAHQGTEARALLAERGLTEEIVAKAEELIAQVKITIKVDDSEWLAKKEAEAKAVQYLWDWYLEWSAIARVAVKNRAHLRSMGFLNGAGGGKASDEVEEEADSSEDEESETEASGEGGPLAAE